MKLTEVRKKKKTFLSHVANVYIDILRGTPVMVQLLLIIYMVIFQNKLGNRRCDPYFWNQQRCLCR